MSLQLRLTVIYLLLAAPVLALFSATVYLVARDRLQHSLDAGLETRADAIESALRAVHFDGQLLDEDIEKARRSLDRLTLEGTRFQVLDADRRVLYSSVNAGEVLSAPDVDRLPGVRVSKDAAGRSRVLLRPVSSFGEHIGYVETQTAMSFLDRSLREIRGVLALGALFVLFATALPAYVLAGRAIDPVRRVSSLASEIEQTADFSRRIAMPATRDEMHELAATFNRMIGRVEKMMQAQRAFLADSSHELRRPLTVLRTNIDVMNDPALSETDRRLIEVEMRAEAESMSRLVANLVLLSRDGELAFDFKPVCLSELCERAVAAMRTAHPRQQFLTGIVPGIWASADAERLEQALANLLQNAAEYSPADGVVRLQVTADDGWADLEVVDYGAGMTAADVEHAFDRFYRGASARERRTQGFGLGLAIVKHVVDAHRGLVRIVSRTGEGTTVSLTLPVAPSPGDPAREPLAELRA
jgi:signal transduction histidine kinase